MGHQTLAELPAASQRRELGLEMLDLLQQRILGGAAKDKSVSKSGANPTTSGQGCHMVSFLTKNSEYV
jgi:hypothetical protein